MLPQSILSEIMTYLALPDLLIISQVSKRFYLFSNIPSIYRREFKNNWMASTTESGQASSIWKSLCLKGIQAKIFWQNLSDYMLTSFELKILYEELTNALAEPLPVFPVLRRDVFSFPTVIQDLLANPEDQFMIDNEHEEYAKAFSDYFLEYYEDLYYSTSSTDLACIRWNVSKIHERDSIGSVSTQDSDTFSQSYLVLLLKAVKKCIKAYCTGIAQLLLETEDLLKHYCEYWENFTYSAKTVNSLFLPLTEVINEFYETKFTNVQSCPRVNFLKIMTGIWRKTVFEPCKEKILAEVIREISVFRSKNYNFFVAQVVQSLLDLSLNELTIFFKNHSLLQIEGPYQYLHNGVLEYLCKYYENYSVDFENEERVLSGMFLNNTVREARRVYCKVEGKRSGNQDLIIETENYEKNDDDLMIEWRAASIGISIQKSSEDIWIYSQCRENKLIDILNHLQSYQESAL